ncbi:MAG: TetR/AcrR family transcriptional regulator [Bacteroidetes bacterium]|nr:TetR/AcrR family transcriptional regulator [Bacteroidota bacterium]
MEKDEIVIQSIIDAAKKLMQQYGLSKTTMEDIAKAAGKGKSTLYHYFKSKDEIFDHVINQEMDDFFQTVKTAVSKQVDASEMLKAYIITKIKTLKTKVNLYRFAFETDLHPDAINDLFIKLKNRYDNEEKKLIGSILKSGIDSKLYRAEIQDDIDILSELLVTCVRGVETEIITHNKYKTLTDKADMLVNILTKGIGR